MSDEAQASALIQPDSSNKLKIQPDDKSLLENLKDWAAVALAGLGVIYATGWVLRSFSINLSGVGPIDISHQSCVAAGLTYCISLLPLAAIWVSKTWKTQIIKLFDCEPKRYIFAVILSVLIPSVFIIALFLIFGRGDNFRDNNSNLIAIYSKQSGELLLKLYAVTYVALVFMLILNWGIIGLIEKLVNNEKFLYKKNLAVLRTIASESLLMFYLTIILNAVLFAELLPSFSPWLGGYSRNMVFIYTDYGVIDGDIIESDSDTYVILLPSVGANQSRAMRIPKKVVRLIGKADEFDTPKEHIIPTMKTYLEAEKVLQPILSPSTQPTVAAIGALSRSSKNVMPGKTDSNQDKNNSYRQKDQKAK